MFKWFKKKKNDEIINFYPETEYVDAIEESLWEIKEEYDLPTEEIISVVDSKRRNLKHIRKMLSKNNIKNKETI